MCLLGARKNILRREMIFLGGVLLIDYDTYITHEIFCNNFVFLFAMFMESDIWVVIKSLHW